MRRIGWAGRVLLAVALAAALASPVLWFRSGTGTTDVLGVAFSLLLAGTHLVWWAVGVVILVRGRVPRIGWLLVLTALFGAVAMGSWAIVSAEIGTFALPAEGPPVALSPLGLAAFLGVSATYGPWFASLILAAIVLFPDGSLTGPRWRLPIALAVGAIATSTVLRILAPGAVSPRLPDNPLGVAALAGLPWALVNALDPLGIAALALIGLASLVVRFRRAGREVRQQLKWLVVAVIPAALATPISFFEPNDTSTSPADLVQIFAITVLMPAAIGLAITRYRLYDIDRIVSRTVAWAAITVILIVVYAAVVLVLQGLLADLTQGQTLAVAASTLAAAALFQPLRVRLQGAMDRRFDRSRYDAERAAAVFADRLRDEVDLGRVGDDLRATVDASLRPASAGLWLRLGSDASVEGRRNDVGAVGDDDPDAGGIGMTARSAGSGFR